MTYGSLQNHILNCSKMVVLWLLLPCVMQSSLGNETQEQPRLWSRFSCAITHNLSAFQNYKHQKNQRAHFHYKNKFSGNIFTYKQSCIEFWIIFRKLVWEFQREEGLVIILCLAWKPAWKCLQLEQTRANANTSLVTTDCPTSSSASVKDLWSDRGDNIFQCFFGLDQVSAL